MEEVGRPHPNQISKDARPTTRNYIKCDQCRTDRKPCVFLGTNPKCTRCTRLGHQCSPPSKVSRKRKAETLTENARPPPQSSSNAQVLAAEATPVLDRVMLGRGADHGQISYVTALNTMAQKLFARAGSDLRNCMMFEKAPGRFLPTPSYQKCQELLHQMCLHVRHLQECLLFGAHSLPPQHHAFGSRASEEVSQSVDPVSGEFIPLLCTANVSKQRGATGSQVRGHIRNAVVELPKHYYLHAEAALKRLMAFISRDTSEEWSALYQQYRSVPRPHGPFPAFTIAYLNLDFETAYQLWEGTLKEGQSPVVDILGRSFPHLVAEFGDPHPLGQMDESVLKNARKDGRGLSLLDLGVIGNSPWIVEKVIYDNIVLPPFTRATQRAILGNRPEIAADHLLPHLKSTTWTDAYELNILVEQAGEKGFLALRDELELIEPIKPVPHDALRDLNACDFSFLDEQFIPSDSSFGFPEVAMSWPPLPDLPSGSNSIDDQEDTRNQSFRNDPGSGFDRHRFGQQYPAS